MPFKRQMKLAAFPLFPGSVRAGWRMPDAVPESDMDFNHYVACAQEAERGKFDTMFFQDTCAVESAAELVKGNRARAHWGRCVRLEPMTVLPALAALTKRIGLIATATTTYNEPYHVARKFATLDHISGGRAGWNLVTSQSEDEAHNFGLEKHPEHALRYERAAEFYEVVTGLWDSWDDDALMRDKASGQFFDFDKVHMLRHKGPHFSVRGPLNVSRPPQGWPVIAQAGSSNAGQDLAARTADVVFTAQTSLGEAQAFCTEVKARADAYARHPGEIKVLPGLLPLLGRSQAEAEDRYQLMQSLVSDEVALQVLARHTGGVDLTKYPIEGPLPELPPSNSALGRQKMLVDLARKENLSIRDLARRFAAGDGHRLVYGTASHIADTMEEWFLEGGADGFTIIFPYFPTPVTEFVDLVIPELQRRGLFRTDYEGKTLRDNLGARARPSRYAT